MGVAVALTALLLAGCQKQSSPEADKASAAQTSKKAAVNQSDPKPGPDRTVSIASITPDPSKPLKPGSDVKMSVVVDYLVPVQGGTVGIVIQDPDNKPVKSNLKDIPGGAGKLTSEIQFVVPKTRFINVHVPLYVKGDNKSSDVAVKQYEISAK